MSGAGRPCVLVAEDLSIVRRPISLILERQGFRAIEAADGEAALAALERERPDAMLLDLSMPGVDGFEVLERLRGRPDRPATIVVTAHPLRANVERALALGASEVVVKGSQPIAGLVEKVRAAIAARAAAATARAPAPSGGGNEAEGVLPQAGGT